LLAPICVLRLLPAAVFILLEKPPFNLHAGAIEPKPARSALS